MKISHLILTGFLALSLNSFAQEATTVIEKKDNVVNESGSALSTKINRATEKDIIKAWKSKMKDFDGDVKTNRSTITATEVKIEAIDPNSIQVFAEVRKATDQEFEFLVIFIKNGVPLSSESDLSGFTAAKSIVRNFANELSKEATEEHHKDQNGIVEDLIKDLESAEKDHKKAEEAIEDAKKRIKEAESTIKEKTKFLSENKKTKAELAKKIEEQKKIIKTAKDEMDLFK
tara:strand:+ start:126 stop:818 length:693 start_codon:yes stop_codon:yes gene_type:complete